MKPVSHSNDGDPASSTDLASVLAAASAGREEAWREIVGRYSRRVFALAKSRCRSVDVAEEITQSVFATVASKLGQGLYSEQGRFESWLFRITMNRVRDEGRRVRRQHTFSDSEARLEVVAAPAMAGARDSRDSMEALRRAIGTLPEADREIIELRHHGGMSFKQIAELLDEPIGTLLARHHRALRKLKDVLGSDSQGRDSSGGM
jgi:RNA polymerase sigma-70 factor (ECF subfamily)